MTLLDFPIEEAEAIISMSFFGEKDKDFITNKLIEHFPENYVNMRVNEYNPEMNMTTVRIFIK